MIDCALTESVLRLQESIIAEYSYDGTIRTRIGNGTTVTVPSGHFLTKDDKYVALSITGDKLYRDCMHQIDRQDLIDHPDYQTTIDRAAHREEINAEFAKWARAHTLKECLDILGEGIPACPIYNVADIMEDPQFAARNDIVEVETEQFGKDVYKRQVQRVVQIEKYCFYSHVSLTKVFRCIRRGYRPQISAGGARKAEPPPQSA